MVAFNRFDVFLVALDPTLGEEIKKTRPCAIVSPDEMNRHIQTVIVAPMTTGGIKYPTRIPVTFRGKRGQLVLDQVRTVDKSRLVKKLGALTEATSRSICSKLVEVFEF